MDAHCILPRLGDGSCAWRLYPASGALQRIQKISSLLLSSALKADTAPHPRGLSGVAPSLFARERSDHVAQTVPRSQCQSGAVRICLTLLRTPASEAPESVARADIVQQEVAIGVDHCSEGRRHDQGPPVDHPVPGAAVVNDDTWHVAQPIFVNTASPSRTSGVYRASSGNFCRTHSWQTLHVDPVILRIRTGSNSSHHDRRRVSSGRIGVVMPISFKYASAENDSRLACDSSTRSDRCARDCCFEHGHDDSDSTQPQGLRVLEGAIWVLLAWPR